METRVENVHPIASIYATILLACDLIRVSDAGLTSVLSQIAPATGSVLFPSFERASNVLEVLSKVASLVYQLNIGRQDFSEDIYFCRVKPIMRLVCVTFLHLNRINSFSDALWRIPGRGRNVIPAPAQASTQRQQCPQPLAREPLYDASSQNTDESSPEKPVHNDVAVEPLRNLNLTS
ncbi:uncharacterized protein F5891DRAFT_1277115 [Suillus fuscotomentosus]|uniref:Uncharacterized protein n=1 Tax=Suillus fuscotomentosus TaxID=1912939 RepID=A0AAD4E9Z3_9AGAM|nr:uncharacterized protein F5891DRAFT_1277115 [Suillus fuscotomentosus]KAG1902438.1 hypothetical protein F5891DRAFT_1277115 [Suillus fuscotomentosus]